MTGLLDRLRSWLGSVFGAETTDGDDVSADVDGQDARDSPTVVHRDDRPLETPSDLDHSSPTESAPVRGASTSGAEHEAPSDPTDDEEAERGRVSIPDAESVAGGAADTPAEGDRANSSGADPEMADDRGDADDDAADGFACAVCGTAVDDPTEACPLCGATDVRPDGERGDGHHESPGGRTAVSAADDEAVERLGDVRDAGDEEERDGGDDAPAPDGDETG
ncbi:hypothetical protein ACOZ4L_12965 [Haloplanus ruber]|uniref:Zinc ribbon domain-containing protein n=1 Tax=Haloplanus ruber TaxID=869892 RepID=A0ABD6CZA1_9EURY|nr:hypothetical protein [Haloplanus ruber]